MIHPRGTKSDRMCDICERVYHKDFFIEYRVSEYKSGYPFKKLVEVYDVEPPSAVRDFCIECAAKIERRIDELYNLAEERRLTH